MEEDQYKDSGVSKMFLRPNSPKRTLEGQKKASPLKVVSPIIKKYSTHRQSRLKKNLQFPRIGFGKTRNKNIKLKKKKLKTLLPKTEEGEVIYLEPELISCALNINPNTCEVSKKCKVFVPNTKINEEHEITEINTPVPTDNHLLSPSSTNKSQTKVGHLSSSAKKKNAKQFKNIEAILALLEDEENSNSVNNEESNYVLNYFMKVQERLEINDNASYQQFLTLISSFQENGLSVVDMYKRLSCILNDHPDLLDEFIAFLSPEQAMVCGKSMEHFLFTKMNDFLHGVDVYFSKTPHLIKKIHAVISALASKPDVTTEEVCNTMLPLLKGNSVLCDYFQQLLPNARPPDSLMTDFETLDCSQNNNNQLDMDGLFETIEIPEFEDQYGGDHCVCTCHNSTDDKYKSRYLHCVPCGTKYINGKIYLQVGKLLKPAKVVFDDYDMTYHRERLAPKLNSKRERGNSKDNLSPTKSCNLSSDELKSDIEEDDKTKGKQSRSPKKAKCVVPKIREKCAKQLFNVEFDKKPEEQFVNFKCKDTVFDNNTIISSFKVTEIKENVTNVFGEVNCLVPNMRNEPCEKMAVDTSHKVPVLVSKKTREKFDLDSRHMPILSLYSDESESCDTSLELSNLIDSKSDLTGRIISILPVETVVNTIANIKEVNEVKCSTNSTLSGDFQQSQKTERKDIGRTKTVGNAKPQIKREKVIGVVSTDPKLDEDTKDSCRTKSPPVLSIPESTSTSSVLPETAKPMLSLLEDLDKTDAIEIETVPKKETFSLKSDVVCKKVESSETKVQNSAPKPDVKSDVHVPEPWKMEEDRIILQTLQVEENCDETFVKISTKISRTVDEIKLRFQTLMKILVEMKGTSGLTSSN